MSSKMFHSLQTNQSIHIVASVCVCSNNEIFCFRPESHANLLFTGQ